MKYAMFGRIDATVSTGAVLTFSIRPAIGVRIAFRSASGSLLLLISAAVVRSSHPSASSSGITALLYPLLPSIVTELRAVMLSPISRTFSSGLNGRSAADSAFTKLAASVTFQFRLSTVTSFQLAFPVRAAATSA